MNKVLMVSLISTIGLITLCGPTVADGPALPIVETWPDPAKQGGVVVVSLVMGEMGERPRKAVCIYEGNRGRLEPSTIPGVHRCLIGIDMNKEPGRHDIEIELTASDGEKSILKTSLQVAEGRFAEERFTLSKKMTDLDEETLERVRGEKARLDSIWEARTPERLWREPFIEPLQGEKGSLFGTRRWINDEPRSPHTGIDVKVPAGTPIAAVNQGKVVFTGEQFFSGKSVILDHGEGLYSMYFHLSEILVPEGSRIERGTTIGLVGSTGRSTGPHLHWGVRMQGGRVDPLSLIERSEGLLQDGSGRILP